MLAFGAIGTYLLTASHAATPTASFEAEAATLSATAGRLTDATASGSQAIKFGVTGTAGCELPAYPTPDCTGVPPGTTFANTVNGTYTVTTAGQHIDKWHITGDLLIRANNVVITNSQVDGTVNNDAGNEVYPSFTISDSTVGPPSACTHLQGASCVTANQNNTSSCVGMPGVGEANYTATRIYVRGHDDGFRLSTGGNATVQDSYFYACYLSASLAPPDGSHSDGVQAVCNTNYPAQCSGWNILHNTIDISGAPATFTLNLTDTNLKSVVANNNMLLGGNNYIIDAWWHSGPNWIFHNNRLVKDTWISNKPWPSLIGAITTEDTCSHQDWQGNTVVTIDSNYNVAGTLGAANCVD